MVVFKLLGLLDLFSAVIIILQTFEFFHVYKLGLIAGLYLIFKGLLFFRDIASKIDILIGLYAIIAIFHSFTILSIVFALHLIVKGVWSILS